jgi:hypothetical protein
MDTRKDMGFYLSIGKLKRDISKKALTGLRKFLKKIDFEFYKNSRARREDLGAHPTYRN